MIRIAAGSHRQAEWLAHRCGLKRIEWVYVSRSYQLQGLPRGEPLICYGDIEYNRDWPEIRQMAALREFNIVIIRRIQ